MDEINICSGLNWTFGFRDVRKWLNMVLKRKEKVKKIEVVDKSIKIISNEPMAISKPKLTNYSPFQQLINTATIKDPSNLKEGLKFLKETSPKAKINSSKALNDEKDFSIRNWDIMRFKYHGRFTLKI